MHYYFKRQRRILNDYLLKRVQIRILHSKSIIYIHQLSYLQSQILLCGMRALPWSPQLCNCIKTSQSTQYFVKLFYFNQLLQFNYKKMLGAKIQQQASSQMEINVNIYIILLYKYYTNIIHTKHIIQIIIQIIVLPLTLQSGYKNNSIGFSKECDFEIIFSCINY